MPDVWREAGDIDPLRATPAVSRTVLALAAAQHGVVARRQLIACGVSETMLRDRLASGLLIPLHRGVYAVGHRRLRREGHWLAAVLAVPGSVLSHRDAAGLHGIRPANHAKTDVTTTGRATGNDGIAVHRTRVLDRQDVTDIEGIPVTSLARTLVDLASAVPQDHLAKALRRAEEGNGLDANALHDTLARTAGRRGPGHRLLRAAIEQRQALGTTLTRSALEDAFQRLVGKHGLPKPQTNVFIEGMEVDAVWHDRQLVVELDGWEHHRTKDAFQRDRERDVRLLAAGWRVARFTHRQVTVRPAEVASTIAALLAR